VLLLFEVRLRYNLSYGNGGADMWLAISAIVILLIASFLHSYCSVGGQMSPVHRPMIFDSSAGTLLQIGWIVLFVVGTAALFVVNWKWGIAAIAVYWLLLPLLVTRIVRKYMLPSWDGLPDGVKDVLERQGYNKHNYLEGDWWKDSEYWKR